MSEVETLVRDLRKILDEFTIMQLQRASLVAKLRSHCNSGSNPGVHLFALELLEMMVEKRVVDIPE